jgi:hypothetical protein
MLHPAFHGLTSYHEQFRADAVVARGMQSASRRSSEAALMRLMNAFSAEILPHLEREQPALRTLLANVRSREAARLLALLREDERDLRLCGFGLRHLVASGADASKALAALGDALERHCVFLDQKVLPFLEAALPGPVLHGFLESGVLAERAGLDAAITRPDADAAQAPR